MRAKSAVAVVLLLAASTAQAQTAIVNVKQTSTGTGPYTVTYTSGTTLDANAKLALNLEISFVNTQTLVQYGGANAKLTKWAPPMPGTSSTFQFDMTSVPAGLYYLRITFGYQNSMGGFMTANYIISSDSVP